MSRNVRRHYVSRGWLGVMYALTALALIPLGLVLWFTVTKGLPSVVHPQFFFNVELPPCEPSCPAVSDAGVGHAIVGTLIMVGLASLMAIPIGILGGIYLAEYGVARWSNWVRLGSDVLVGTPSIAIGLFAYAFLVVPFHHFSAFSGSVALAVLMLPIVTRTTEGAVSLIPNGLRESGLALGLPRWRVSLQLVLPPAAPGVITGALLSAARAGAEPAGTIQGPAVTVMREAGADLVRRVPGLLTEEMAEWADVVVTLGCGDACPVLPGKRYVEWELPDPAGLGLDEVRAIRDDIKTRVTSLVKHLDRDGVRG